MNEQEVRELAQEAVAHINRGECRFVMSDEPDQPEPGPCRQPRCDMCAQPMPGNHLHVYEQSELLNGLREEPPSWMSPEEWEVMQRAVLGVGRMLSRHAQGFCSEGCAGRFVAGEPTTSERDVAEEMPYATALFHLMDRAVQAGDR